MRAWCFKETFGLDNLIMTHSTVPDCGPDEVLLEMQSTSLNYRDLVVMRGHHGRAVTPPLVPLSDGVGVIMAVGARVAGFAEGDRVSPSFYQHWQGGAPPVDLERGRLGGPLDGVLATHRTFAGTGLVHVPDHLSNAEAATLPCAGVTAWSALLEPTPLRAGETVLILGTGGVALMALQLAKAVGGRVIMTTSDRAKAKRLIKLGADDIIDRSTVPDWSHVVRDLTGGIGADRVLDLAGAATLNTSIKAVKTGGTILLIGNVSGNVAEISLPLVLTRRITLHSVSCGSQETFRSLCRVVDLHRIKPIIGKEFAFQSAASAYDALETGQVFGKICVSCTEESQL